MKRENFEADISDQLHPLEIPPPERVWDGLDRKLSKGVPARYPSRTIGGWIVVAGLLIIFSLLYIARGSNSATPNASPATPDDRAIFGGTGPIGDFPVADALVNEAALRVNDWQEDGQQLLLFFYSLNCENSPRLEKETLNQPAIQNLLDENHVKTVRINFEDKKNLGFLKNYAVNVSPTLLLLNAQGTIVCRVNGFMQESSVRALLETALDCNDTPPIASVQNSNRQDKAASASIPRIDTVTTYIGSERIVSIDTILETTDQQLARWREKDRILMLYFYRENCPYCPDFESETLAQPEIKALIDEKFKMVSIDLGTREGMDDLIRKYEVSATPSLLFLNDLGEVIHRVRGYREKSEMEMTLREVITGRTGIGAVAGEAGAAIIKIENVAPSSSSTNLHRAQAFKISPNPSTGRFQVEWNNPEMETTTLQIITLGGRIVQKRELPAVQGGVSQSFNLSGEPKGYYVVRIERGREVLVQKLLLQ